jgi:hypothetical protein
VELSGGKNLAEILLHGEEEVEQVRELLPGREYVVRTQIVDIIDKGKMTIVVLAKDMTSSG